MFSDYFRNIYCVNLARRTDRWQQASKYFVDCGVPAKRFEAIDAKDFKREYPIKTSAVACSLSHIFIIKQAKFLGWDNVFIFEDDVELRNGFNQIFDEAIKEVPFDWELLYLGGSHNGTNTKITDRVYKVDHTLTTHSYAIRHTVYDKVLKEALKFEQPIDGALCEIQKRGKAYAINPPVAFQADGFSDVESRNVSYPWIKRDLK